ncbi:MAG: 30S ribosomal protein S17 [Bradymonadales bacterium]|nr:30S ribosomal protein S17 [Bradymonadales bacterium]
MTARGHRKNQVGVVVSDKMQKTVVVQVTRRFKHPMYHKYVKRSNTYYAHDETNACRVGDRILIEETRPMSRLKRWRVKSIIERAPIFN